MSYQEQTTQNQTVDDDVLVRLATHDLLDTAAAAGYFSRFLAAVSQAGLQNILRGPDLFTVFAPRDEACDHVEASKLAELVRGHIVQGALTSDEVKTGGRLNTIEGTTLAVGEKDGFITIGEARIVAGDMECTNGILHGIDRVLGT